MCRNIRVLLNFAPPATDEEVHAAALQYVRKVTGSAKPSKANEAQFAKAVEEIAAITRRLVDEMEVKAPPRTREVFAAKLKARSLKRFSQ
ncbi:MAG: DUF2277 domain-containing protein [Myxococcales bacterium]|nr:DUF2277 domain-containing protein [Myxococcales bacterium]